MKLVLERVQAVAGSFMLDVDLALQGRAIGLYGDSGAGKTTLLEVIAGLRRPERGCVRLGDTVLDDVARRQHVPAEARGIGYVPQDGALFPHLSVRQNLHYGRRPRAVSHRPALSVEAILSALDIADLIDRRVPGLSGGETSAVGPRPRLARSTASAVARRAAEQSRRRPQGSDPAVPSAHSG
jgi:molybdate transport system ATP-binding protein